MQIMGDSLTVFGSRLGIAWNPAERESYLVRHTDHPGIPLEINAGIRIEGRTVVLPLTSEGEVFKFLDQGMTAATMTMGGIDPETGLHVKLTVTIPFRPRDIDFSTIPAVFFNLEADKILSTFRWEDEPPKEVKGTVFLEFGGDNYEFSGDGNGILVEYTSKIIMPREGTEEERKTAANDSVLEGGRKQGTVLDEENIKLQDKIVLISGNLRGNSIEADFILTPGAVGPRISAAWCSYDKPVLNVLGDRCEFRYKRKYKSLEEVAEWAIKNANLVYENAKKVDSIILGSNLGETLNHLLSQTLHSWLTDSWLVVRPNGQEWYTVWEGSCYFLSTVDVEYTMSPFYLSLWPELLEMNLNQWALFGKDGSKCLGKRGDGTLYLSHDIGLRCACIGQLYDHDMEVEESANYIIMAYTHWRRTGKDNVLRQNIDFIKRLLNFIVACDTTGNGIVDKGCVNTIDDASPAIQFGAEQIYIGVKAMVACQVGAAILEYLGEKDTSVYTSFAQKALSAIESQGWKKDHYIVTLTKKMDGLIDPWSREPLKGNLEGWDAYHIYTENGLALLDMTGYDCGLSLERLKKDIETSIENTLGKYGCRHTSYLNENPANSGIQGFVSAGMKLGWVSMNILRDIAACYRGIDLLSLSNRYWDWQSTTNTREYVGFFETFYGNNLNFYPRGVAIFGYLDASVGFIYDKVNKIKAFNPVRASLKVPLYLFADWHKGCVPYVKTWLTDGKIEYEIEE